MLSYNSSSDKAVQIGQEITEMGRRAVAFQCDVGESAQCDDLARKAEKAFGQIDVDAGASLDFETFQRKTAILDGRPACGTQNAF